MQFLILMPLLDALSWQAVFNRNIAMALTEKLLPGADQKHSKETMLRRLIFLFTLAALH